MITPGTSPRTTPTAAAETASTTTGGRRPPLTALRAVAGVIGLAQVAGALNFLVINPEQTTWLGPWIDVPVTTMLLSGVALKLGLASWPRLAARRRVDLALTAVVLGVLTTLVKITLYAEPEAVTFLLADAVLLTLAVRARRAGADRSDRSDRGA